ASGLVINGSIGTVQINDLMITGSDFAGGTIDFSLNGTPVDVTGTATTSTVQGTFYGIDGSIPAETGGVLLVSGDTGQVTGVFVAD
ncbi:MAG: hypothetical protein AAF386_12465, partial [Pseudomonadota bacterium]